MGTLNGSGDYPVTRRDLKAVQDDLVEVRDELRDARKEARDHHAATTNAMLEMHAYAVPGLRSAWTLRLATIALVAAFSGSIFGAVTVRAVTSDARASESREHGK